MTRPVRSAAAVELSERELRILGAWAADCAERTLPIFEAAAPGDTRPRDAIAGIRAFARGGKRDAKLRAVAWGALKAARDVGNAAAASARAAGLAAGTAYLHPIATVHQTKHIHGPATYAARARQLARGNGDEEIEHAIATVPPEVRTLLRRYPARAAGSKGALDALLYRLDVGLRRRA